MQSVEILQSGIALAEPDWVTLDASPSEEEHWYAVIVGRRPGIYRERANIPANLENIPGALVMKCPTEERARQEFENALQAGTVVRVRVNSSFDSLHVSDLATLPMGDHNIPEIELSRRWYTVTVGRNPGVFNGPTTISANISGIPGAKAAKFYSMDEARDAFIAALRAGSVEEVVYDVTRRVLHVGDRVYHDRYDRNHRY